MPTYDYQCSVCEHHFEKVLTISEKDKPTKQKCPECGKKKVKKLITAPLVCDPMRIDAARKKLPGGWKDVLHKIHDRAVGSQLDQTATGF